MRSEVKLTKVLAWICGVSAAVFFGGTVLAIPVMAVSFVAPDWWQYVFLAVAVPTLASAPILIVSATLAALTQTDGEGKQK